jgi:D-3-phosphoglycerate dehydrogenase
LSWRVLVSAPHIQKVLDRFRPIFDEHEIEIIVSPVKERLSEEDLLRWVGEIDGVICGDDQFTKRVLEAAPRLKVISKWGTGIDSIDLTSCKHLGIIVCNTPNAFTEPVADTVLGYILCFSRQLLGMNQDMLDGKWYKRSGKSLHECTLGIIGVGNIGRAVVRRANAFGMQVLGSDIVELSQEFIAETHIKMLSNEDLLSRADFVSINCDLNPTSFHLISDQELSLMKPTSVLINTARGPVVNETALIRALQQKQIAGAALDVFEEEPLPEDSPLRKMDNVLLAPHNANNSPEAWEYVHQNTIRNLLEVLKKEKK